MRGFCSEYTEYSMDTGWGCLAGVADSSNDLADQQERGVGGWTSWALEQTWVQRQDGPWLSNKNCFWGQLRITVYSIKSINFSELAEKYKQCLKESA